MISEGIVRNEDVREREEISPIEDVLMNGTAMGNWGSVLLGSFLDTALNKAQG